MRLEALERIAIPAFAAMTSKKFRIRAYGL